MRDGLAAALGCVVVTAALSSCDNGDASLGNDSILLANEGGDSSAGAGGSGGEPAPEPDAGEGDDDDDGRRHCGGLTFDVCPPEQFCKFDEEAVCGYSGQHGHCEDIPQSCGPEFDPVCGCDGRLYGSACEANSVGLSVIQRGDCPPPPPRGGQACGGFGDEPCPANQYCAPAAGSCGGPGICLLQPSSCPRDVWPVCGCDHHTYDNGCLAVAAGVPVDYQGSCEDGRAQSPYRVCGGPDAIPCADDEFCDLALGDGCDSIEGMGICRWRGAGNCERQEYPVCACDGTTYPNPCVAAAVGASLRHLGPCPL